MLYCNYHLRNMKILLLLLSLFSFNYLQAQNETYVELTTPKGLIVLKLYNETPKHRDKFLEVIKNGWYDGAQFNRIIQGFVIQGGMLDDEIEKREKRMDKPGPRIDEEIKDSLIHKKGALGAGRNSNPEKSSFVNQFYIVQGKTYTDQQLDSLEQGKMAGRQIPAWKRAIYKAEGGIPYLDNDFTIFGEVVVGLDIVDTIAALPTYPNDHPKSPCTIKFKVVKKKDAVKYSSHQAGK